MEDPTSTNQLTESLQVPAAKATMAAAVREVYGTPEVLRVEDVAIPALGEEEILVRVVSSSVNPLEWHILTGTPYLARLRVGLRRPKRPNLGADIAGIVVAVGGGVTEFAPGDEVFGETWGAYAEFAVAKEKALTHKPENVTFAEAGSVAIAAFTALQGLRNHGGIKSGDRVLINGASGGVGTFAVQIATALGAEVTAVCSTRNVAMVTSLGADRVIDYTSEDFAATGRSYDLVLDTVGNRSILQSRSLLAPNGVYVGIGGPKKTFALLARMAGQAIVSVFGKRRMRSMLAKVDKDDLEFLSQMLESGRVTPVIDRTYPLRDVADALRHQGEGHARGKTVIAVTAPPDRTEG